MVPGILLRLPSSYYKTINNTTILYDNRGCVAALAGKLFEMAA